MNGPIRWLALAAAFCLSTQGALAQNSVDAKKPSPSMEDHGGDRGLLLGIYFPDGVSWNDIATASPNEKWVPEISDQIHGQYLTFWITKTRRGEKIEAIQGLIVPRENGFWRVGSVLVRSSMDPGSSYDEQLWAVPVSEKPPGPKIDPGTRDTSVCLLTYAGSDYLSYLAHSQGGAGAWEYTIPGVVAIDALEKEETIAAVLGSTMAASYKRRAKSLDHMDEDWQGEPCGCCQGRESEWGIVHAGDRWQVFARFHYGTSSDCAQGSTDEEFDVALPKRMAPGGTLGGPWELVRTETETALHLEAGSVQHIFVSPKQDLLVALTKRGLAVVRVENLHPEAVLKTQDFDGAAIPVMEQWSLGRFVEKWDSVLQKETPGEIPTGKNR